MRYEKFTRMPFLTCINVHFMRCPLFSVSVLRNYVFILLFFSKSNLSQHTTLSTSTQHQRHAANAHDVADVILTSLRRHFGRCRNFVKICDTILTSLQRQLRRYYADEAATKFFAEIKNFDQLSTSLPHEVFIVTFDQFSTLQ